MGMMMVLDPVEVFSSAPGCADKVKVEHDNGTDLGSLTGSLEGSFLGDSLELTLLISLTGSLEGSHDVIPYGSFLGWFL